MRALKILVVLMGVMLVGGVVVLVGVILSRLGGKPSPAPPVAGLASPGFGTSIIDIPAGAVVSGTFAVGKRLVLQIALEDGTQRLLVLDPGSGALLGTIELRPER
jgi:hypothetical protein